MQADYPKVIKRRIRELAGFLYEKSLAAALGDLETEFARWRQGQCDAFELEERVHKSSWYEIQDSLPCYAETADGPRVHKER